MYIIEWDGENYPRSFSDNVVWCSPLWVKRGFTLFRKIQSSIFRNCNHFPLIIGIHICSNKHKTHSCSFNHKQLWIPLAKCCEITVHCRLVTCHAAKSQFRYVVLNHVRFLVSRNNRRKVLLISYRFTEQVVSSVVYLWIFCHAPCRLIDRFDWSTTMKTDQTSIVGTLTLGLVKLSDQFIISRTVVRRLWLTLWIRLNDRRLHA